MPQQISNEILRKADSLYKDIWNCQKEFERRRADYAALEARQHCNPSEAVGDGLKSVFEEATNSVIAAEELKQALLGILDDYSIITQADTRWLLDAGPPPVPGSASQLPPLPFPHDEIAQQLEAGAKSTSKSQMQAAGAIEYPDSLFDLIDTVDPALIDPVTNAKYSTRTLDRADNEDLESYIYRQIRALTDVEAMQSLHRRLLADLQLRANLKRGQEIAEHIRDQLLWPRIANSGKVLQPPRHIEEDLEMEPYEYRHMIRATASRVIVDIDFDHIDESLIADMMQC